VSLRDRLRASILSTKTIIIVSNKIVNDRESVIADQCTKIELNICRK